MTEAEITLLMVATLICQFNIGNVIPLVSQEWEGRFKDYKLKSGRVTDEEVRDLF